MNGLQNRDIQYSQQTALLSILTNAGCLEPSGNLLKRICSLTDSDYTLKLCVQFAEKHCV